VTHETYFVVRKYVASSKPKALGMAIAKLRLTLPHIFAQVINLSGILFTR